MHACWVHLHSLLFVMDRCSSSGDKVLLHKLCAVQCAQLQAA